jgi:hypothetical protein
LTTKPHVARSSLAVTRLSGAILIALASIASIASADPGDPAGPAERIHPVAEELSAAPTVAMSPAGQRIQVYGADTFTGGELLGVFDYSATPQPSPLRLVVAEQEHLGFPAVAMTKYGFFLTAWEQRSTTGASEGVFARAYSRLGNPTGEQFKVNTTAASGIDSVVVAANGYGTRYLVAWVAKDAVGHSVRAQILDHEMQPVAAELRIDGTGTDAAMTIGAGMSPAGSTGSAYVTWTGYAEVDPTFAGTVFVRKIDEEGILGAPRVVMDQHAGNGDSVVYFEQPALAASVDGSIVVVFRAQTSANHGYERSSRLIGRRYDADLQPTGGLFDIAPALPFVDAYAQPQVAVDAFGGFTVSWTARQNPDEPAGIHARRFDAEDNPVDEAFVVAPSGGDTNNLMSRIAVDADGDTTVVWTALGSSGRIDAMSRRYRGFADVDLSVEMTAPESAYPGHPWVEVVVRVANNAPWPQGNGSGWDPSTEGVNTATGIVVDLDLSGSPEPYVYADDRWQCSGNATLRCTYGDLLSPASTAPDLTLWISTPLEAGPMLLSAQVSGDQHDPLPHNDHVTASVYILNLVPDAFAFEAVTDVEPNSLQVSNPTQISGIEGMTWGEVSNGEGSVNGGEFRTGWLALNNGDLVRLRHHSAGTSGTSTTTTLSIADVSGSFTSTTAAIDTTPDAFAFIDQTAVAPGTTVTSAPIVVSGINAPTAISVVGGSYSINGGAFTTMEGTVVAGDEVRARLTAATTASTATDAMIIIGGVSATFTAVTGPHDTTPDAFAFTDVAGARRGRDVTSDQVRVAGIDTTAPISIVGGGASYSKNGSPYTSAPGTVENGDRIRLRMTASSTAFATVSTRLSIGSEHADWNVTSGSK